MFRGITGCGRERLQRFLSWAAKWIRLLRLGLRLYESLLDYLSNLVTLSAMVSKPRTCNRANSGENHRKYESNKSEYSLNAEELYA